MCSSDLYPGYAYPMIGLHPEEVKADWKEQLAPKSFIRVRGVLPGSNSER